MELDDFEQKKDENDGEDEAEAASAVVAETWTHAVTTEAEHQNQDNQKDKHFTSPCSEGSLLEGMMLFFMGL
jgi:hypothetical protein